MIVASSVVHGIVHALSFAGGMTWEILWAPILSASPSPASSSAVVSKREMRRLMPPKTLLAASGVGAASSSCSYASVALARSLPPSLPPSLFKKGADFTAAMVFEFWSPPD